MPREVKFKRKRFYSFIIVLGYFFFEGCDDVVILPTCWDYLQTLGVTEENYLGYTLSTFSGVIGGRLADKYYNHTKAIVATSIIFRALGNFQYMIGINVWNILISRVVCGISSACGTSLIAEICRITTMDERKTFISGVTAAFQIGILIGPGLQIFLSYFNFIIFGFAINPLNAPGLFMGVLWSIYWLMSLVMFSNLSEEFKEIQQEKNRPYEVINSELSTILESDCDSGGQGHISKEIKQDSIYQLYLNEFLTDSYVFLLYLAFTLYFQQVALETVIPVITEVSFGFNTQQITMIYWSGGLEALAVFTALIFWGKYIRESTLLVVGLLIMVTAHVWLISVVPYFEKGNPTHVAYFLIGTFLFYLASPFTNVGNAALTSKVLSHETQGLGQGLRRLMTYTGLIFGPTWAGSTVHQPRLFIGLTLGLVLLNVFMLTGSFGTLREAEDKIIAKNETNVGDDETSLLSSTA